MDVKVGGETRPRLGAPFLGARCRERADVLQLRLKLAELGNLLGVGGMLCTMKSNSLRTAAVNLEAAPLTGSENSLKRVLMIEL